MQKLKPCPFCGKIETVKVYSKRELFGMYHTAFCDYNAGGCGAQGGSKNEKEKAVKTWNERAGICEKSYLEEKEKITVNGYMEILLRQELRQEILVSLLRVGLESATAQFLGFMAKVASI